MNKFQQMYSEYLDFNESTLFLIGDNTPDNIDSLELDKLIEKFLYTYSFLGLSSSTLFTIDNVKTILSERISNLKNFNKLNHIQRWWGLSLCYLEMATSYYEVKFLDHAIKTLLNKIHTLNENELILYCNEINEVCSTMICFELRLRPSCNNNKKAYISELMFNITSNKDLILDSLKSNFSLTEVMNDEVFKEQLTVSAITDHSYSSWDCVFDIFTSIVITNAESPFNKDFMIGDGISHIVETSLLNLLSNCDNIPDNISNISDDISLILS